MLTPDTLLVTMLDTVGVTEAKPVVLTSSLWMYVAIAPVELELVSVLVPTWL